MSALQSLRRSRPETAIEPPSARHVLADEIRQDAELEAEITKLHSAMAKSERVKYDAFLIVDRAAAALGSAKDTVVAYETEKLLGRGGEPPLSVGHARAAHLLAEEVLDGARSVCLDIENRIKSLETSREYGRARLDKALEAVVRTDASTCALEAHFHKVKGEYQDLLVTMTALGPSMLPDGDAFRQQIDYRAASTTRDRWTTAISALRADATAQLPGVDR